LDLGRHAGPINVPPTRGVLRLSLSRWGIEQMLGFAGSAPDMDTSKQKTP